MNTELADNLIDRVAIGDLLRRRARDAAQATAIADYSTDPPAKLTFRELNDKANRFGRVLQGAGANKGDRVVVVSPNCTDIATVMYACFKAGLVYVPLNFAMSDNDLLYVVDHCTPACAVVHPSLRERWKGLTAKLSCKPFTLLMGGEADAEFAGLDMLAQAAGNGEIDDVIIHDRDPAQILYTSGTTSRPKGAVNTHLNLFISSMNMALVFHLERGDSYASPLPLFHTAAQGHMLMTHQVGGMFAVSAFQAKSFADMIEHERINGVFLLPMMWKAILALDDIDRRDFSCVKRALYAMAPMSAAILDRLHQVFGCPFNQTSGQTETSVATKYYDGNPVEFPGGNYWGRPVPIVDQAVLDDDGNELPRGQVGEICWRGPNVMQSYYRDEAALREARRFGWHHSGDLGMIDACGELLFVDRKKDMVKSGGENVSSVRVEQVLLGLPGVKAAAVVGLPHPKWEEAVTAFLLFDPAVKPDLDAIRSHCQANLGRFEVPKHIEIVEALPLTPTGKVQKHELRKRFSGLFVDAA